MRQINTPHFKSVSGALAIVLLSVLGLVGLTTVEASRRAAKGAGAVGQDNRSKQAGPGVRCTRLSGSRHRKSVKKDSNRTVTASNANANANSSGEVSDDTSKKVSNVLRAGNSDASGVGAAASPRISGIGQTASVLTTQEEQSLLAHVSVSGITAAGETSTLTIEGETFTFNRGGTIIRGQASVRRRNRCTIVTLNASTGQTIELKAYKYMDLSGRESIALISFGDQPAIVMSSNGPGVPPPPPPPPCR